MDNKEWRAKAVKMFDSGSSYNSIARELMLARTTVTRYLHGMGCYRDVPEKVLEANSRTASTLKEKAKKYTCKHCGVEFRPKVYDRVSYCTRECYFESIKVEPKEKVLRVCVICGAEFEGRADRKYCTDECKKERARRDARERDIKTFEENISARTCKYCGNKFTPKYGSKKRTYCSDECSVKGNKKAYRQSEAHKVRKKRHNQTRRAVLRGAEVGRYVIRDIYSRDGWRCQLCGGKVCPEHKYPHPKSATIDHRVPLSWGGSDTEDNVQLAHFICNSLKGGNNIMPNKRGQLMLV